MKQVTSIFFSSGDATSLQLDDCSIDIVFLKSVLCGNSYHQGEPGITKALTEIYRVLKQGRFLLFAENTFSSPVHPFLRDTFIENRGDSHTWPYHSYQYYISLFSIYTKHKIHGTALLGTLISNKLFARILYPLDRLILRLTYTEPSIIYWGIFK
jgi:ubiquinone/menaquinone biosynthesis C-methylase UbiE